MLREFYAWCLAISKTRLRKSVIVAEPESNSKTKIPYTASLPEPQLLGVTKAELALREWNQGDKHALANITVDDLSEHPARARLALAFGTANQHIGNSEKARLFISVAKQWGCDRKLIAYHLVTDARRSVDRALELLASRPKVDYGASTKDAVKDDLESHSKDIDLTSSNIHSADTLEKKFEKKKSIPELIEDQALKVESIGRELKNEIKNVSTQLESVLRIQSYLETGKFLPPFHGWPVSPDFICFVMKRIERKDYSLVIEFGSGTSTALIASSIDSLHGHKIRPYQLAFEHLEKYHAETDALINERRLVNHSVNLVLTPLAEMSLDSAHVNIYKFYDCKEFLYHLAQENSSLVENLLVIVDGPPGLTGRHARYPAMQIVLNAFPKANIDFILDDTNRKDEQEIVQMWIEVLDRMKRSYEHIPLDFEKGASLIEVRSVSQEN